MGLIEFITAYWDWYVYGAVITWFAAVIKQKPEGVFTFLFSIVITFFAWPALLIIMLTDD